MKSANYGVVSTWLNRKVAALTAKKDEDIIAVKVTDGNYASLRNLKKTNEKCESLINLGSFVFSDEIKGKISEIRKAYNASVAAVNETATNALARLELADDYADTIKILKSFKILNRNGKIDA